MTGLTPDITAATIAGRHDDDPVENRLQRQRRHLDDDVAVIEQIGDPAP